MLNRHTLFTLRKGRDNTRSERALQGAGKRDCENNGLNFILYKKRTFIFNGGAVLTMPSFLEAMPSSREVNACGQSSRLKIWKGLGR